MSARARFAIAATVVVGSMAGLIGWALSASPVYYRTPSELTSDQPGANEKVRLFGKVLEGSVDKSGTTTTFGVTDGDQTVRVTTADLLPDTFGPGVEVVAEGSMTQPGNFSATTVLAKCPSKFKAKRTASKI